VSRCFTLAGVGSIQFNFETDTDDDRRVWLSSLSQVMSIFGADVDEASRNISSPSSSSSSSVSSPARGSPVAPRYIPIVPGGSPVPLGPTLTDRGEEIKAERKGPQTGVRVHIASESQTVNHSLISLCSPHSLIVFSYLYLRSCYLLFDD
jgi:hypothetical protein